MFFDNWTDLIKILVVGALAYVALIVILRISGKRTLAQMNAFDFVVTVALGSTLSTAILSKDTPLAEGLLGLALLVSLQFLVAWVYVRSPFLNRLVKAEPRLLFYQGEFKEKALKEERVKKEELLQAIRNQGILSLAQVEAIVLETNGKFSVLKPSDHVEASTLQNVRKN